MRNHYQWGLRRRPLALGMRTLIMGVLNTTPDSFSDGGKFLEPGMAVEHGLRLLAEGADILDIGGESTRPGTSVRACTEQPSGAVSPVEELRRVLPIIEAILQQRPNAVISVDTYKAEVARMAVGVGAEIVNDVSGLKWDSRMAATVAELGCGLVLTHMRGLPAEWRSLPPLEDPVGLVSRELRGQAAAAVEAGIQHDRIVLDPGLGFGKKFEENYPLIARFDEFHRLEFPLLAGPSRKSFIGRTLRQNGDDAPPEHRLYGTLAAITATILKGVHVVRVHDVDVAVQAAKVADEILRACQQGTESPKY